MVNQSPIPHRRKPLVEDGVAGPSCLIKLSESDGNHSRFPHKGPATRSLGVNKNIARIMKMYMPRRTQIKERASDSLSDIDDNEVTSYLNSKEEVLLKTILWEAMNKEYINAKKQKRKAKTKKVISTNKAAKATEKVEIQRPSSRINYDALKTLDDEWREGSETAQIIRADSGTDRIDDSLDGNISPGMHGSSDSGNRNSRYRNYFDDSENLDGDMDAEGYGDEHFDVEYF